VAEEVLIAELRAATSKFDADLKKATQASEKASKAIVDALNGINDSVKDLPKSLSKFNDELKETQRHAEKASKSAGGFGGALGSLKGIIAGIGLVALAQQMFQFGRGAFTASQQLDATSRQLNKLTGDTSAAAKEMAFISAETRRLAFDTAEGAKGFVQIANAAKGTIAEGEGVRQIFSAINEVASANNLTQEQYGTLLQQTTQMMAKGKAELEDLKIIAEAGVPVFQLLGKSLGLSQEEVFKSISAGKIGMREMLILTQEMRKEYGRLAEDAANTIPAKFKRGFNDLKLGLADVFSGVLASTELNKLLSSMFGDISVRDMLPSKEEVTKFLDDWIPAITAIGAYFKTVFQGVGHVVRITLEAINAGLTWVVNQATFVFRKTGQVTRQVLETLSWGKLFKGASQEAEVTAGEVESVWKSMVDGLGKLDWTQITDPKKLTENFNQSSKQIRDTLGLDSSDGVAKDTILDPDASQEKASEAAEKTRQEWLAKIDQMKGDFKKSKDELSLVASEKEAEKARKKQEAEIKEQIKNYKSFLKVLSDLDKQRVQQLQKDLDRENEARQEREAEAAKVQEEAQKTYDNMKENVQETLSGLISDSIKGDLGNIKDMLDNVLDLFASFAAEAASKFVIDAVFDDAVDFLMGPLNKETGRRGGGFFSTQIPGGQGGIGTVGGAASVLGAGFAGGQVGGAIGGRFGGKTGSIAGGVLGGAAAGAAMGAVIGGGILSIPAAAIGAVAGAVVGGITSAIQAGAFSSPKKSSLGVQTGAQLPGDIRGDSFRRSPFGFLTVFEEASASDDLIASALTLISETDRAIASHLDTRQREIVDNYFKTAIPDGNIVRAEADDDAIAKLVAQRYYQAITAIAGQDIAENVVGSPFGATKGSIGTIQQRANAALALLKQIEEFRIGPITETASAIKAINEQFQALIDQATTLGIPTDEIVAEQQRQLAEITSNFNQDITDSILAIKDPVAAEYAALEREQEERRKNAVDAEADLTALAELETLEREELAKRLNQATDGATSATDALIGRLDAFVRQGMSGASQSIYALQQQFIQLRDEMTEAGLSTAQLTAAYQQQAAAIRHQAQEQVLGALYAITNPFQAAMLSMAAQVREFSKLVAEGIIPQSTLDAFVQAASEQARYQEALRLASGQGGAADQFQQMVEDFVAQGANLSDTERELKALTDQFENLRDALVFLGVDTSVIEAHYQKQAQAIRDRAKEEEKAERERAKADRQAEADRRKAERERLMQLRDQFTSALLGITNPYAEAVRQVKKQVEEFQELVKKGLISRGQLARYRRLALGGAAVDEAQRLIGGGPRTPIEGIADAFQQFVQAGSPVSQAAQRMRELTGQFRGLMDAAGVLRLNTKELEKSYRQQARAIREEAIKAIDQQLEAQKQQIESIGTYLKQLKVGEELPAHLRFNEARDQFLSAVRGGNIDEALSAAETYRGIARERFGGTEAFFSFRGEIERILGGLQEQQRYRLEQERNRLIRQEERDLQRVQLERSSLDHLRQVRGDTSEMARGLRELIVIARGQAASSARTETIIRRVMDQIRA